MKRREFGRLMTALAALPGLTLSGTAQAAARSGGPANRTAVVGDRNQATIDEIQTFMGGDAVRVGIVLYPSVFELDVVNLVTVFQALGGSFIHLIAKDKNPVGNDPSDMPTVVPLQPTDTFADAPKDLDVLILPGTLPGKYGLMEDKELIAYVQETAKTSKIVASVGTGALIMASAGLLYKRRATTFWPFKPMLAELGTTVVNQRVVVDGNRVTAAGATASMDLGLKLIELVRNPSQSQLVQLYLEYDPSSAAKGGSPERAQANVSSFMSAMYSDTLKEGRDVAKRVAAGLKAGSGK